MKRVIKRRIFICLGVVAGVLTAAFLALLITLTVAEYRPEDVEELVLSGTPSKEVVIGEDIFAMSWNIGYGALGDNADFFMDGGSHVMTADRQRVQQNLGGIVETIRDIKPDLVLLQEMDLDSKRSYNIDERQEIAGQVGVYQSSFAYNYKVLYVPYPLPTMGKVECGLCTLSSYGALSSRRMSLPCPFKYPIRLCNLKRCLMVNRIPVKDSEREFVVVNLHLEAYDSGEGKAAQTAVLRDFLEQEVEKGNYVLVGGDFNQTFSNIDTSMYPLINGDMWQPAVVETEDFSEQLQFLMDNRVPSCRSLDRQYIGADPNDFQYYMIDGFIVSDNIEVDSMETLDLQFVHSDHNPILLRFKLK